MTVTITIEVGINQAAGGIGGIKRQRSSSTVTTRAMDVGMGADLDLTFAGFPHRADGPGSGKGEKKKWCKNNGGVVARYTACSISTAFREPTRNPS